MELCRTDICSKRDTTRTIMFLLSELHRADSRSSIHRHICSSMDAERSASVFCGNLFEFWCFRLRLPVVFLEFFWSVNTRHLVFCAFVAQKTLVWGVL